MKTFLIAILSILLSVAAQFSLKEGMSQLVVNQTALNDITLMNALTILTNRFIILGFLLYGFGAIVWLGVLSKWDVSKAYPLVGIGFIFTTIVGASLGEEVTAFRFVGVVMIAVGVAMVANT